jgi:4-amino-4-deoxy-L-arabinose transferase-like glycosyltransferase
MILALLSTVTAALVAAAAWLGLLRQIRKLDVSDDWRITWILATVAWGAWVAVMVEVGSALAILGRPYFLGALGLPAWYGFRGAAAFLKQRRPGAGFAALREQGRPATLFIAATMVIVAWLACQGALGAPTTHDSMTYHLPRVMHWLQERTVDFYPTLNPRQLESGPWASFATMALYSLSGGDRLLWLVQWFAMVTTLVAISAITSQLLALQASIGFKANHSTTKLAAAVGPLLMATLPIGIAEATSAQNDYVTTCWICCFVALGLAQLQRPNITVFTIGAGLTLGLGALTKAVFLLFAIPLASIAAVLICLRLSSNRARAQHIAIIALCIVAITAPQASRSIRRFGSPLGSPATVELQRNGSFTLSGTASNVIRNLTLHTGTGVPSISRQLNRGLLYAHKLTGRDLNDPTTTFAYTPFTTSDKFSVSDSAANSAYHLVLILVTGAVFLLKVRRAGAPALAYLAVVSVTFLAFCAYLRWQPWHARFHMSIYALLMPMSAIALARNMRRLVSPILVGFLLVGAVSYCSNISAPSAAMLFSGDREAKYFLLYPTWHKSFAATAEAIVRSGCSNVGYSIGFDSWEYPIWAMLKNRGFHGTLRSISDSGAASEGLLTTVQPCAVIVLGLAAPTAVTQAMQPLQADLPIPIYVMPSKGAVSPPQPPKAVAVKPASGRGRAQRFVFTIADESSSSNLAGSALLISAGVSSSGSCYILYDATADGLDLATDSGSWKRFERLGSPTILENSQCKVTLPNSSVQRNTLELTVSVDVSFRQSFSGSKAVYVYGATRGGLTAGWRHMGDWVVP